MVVLQRLGAKQLRLVIFDVPVVWIGDIHSSRADAHDVRLRACTHTCLDHIQHLGRRPCVPLIANRCMYVKTVLVTGVPAKGFKHTAVAQTLHLVAAIIYLNALRKNAVAYNLHNGLVADFGLVLVQRSRIHLRASLSIHQTKPGSEDSSHVGLAVFARQIDVTQSVFAKTCILTLEPDYIGKRKELPWLRLEIAPGEWPLEMPELLCELDKPTEGLPIHNQIVPLQVRPVALDGFAHVHACGQAPTQDALAVHLYCSYCFFCRHHQSSAKKSSNGLVGGAGSFPSLRDL